MQSILGAAHYARLRRATAVVTFAALLKSEFFDSPKLGYLRPTCFASCGTKGNFSFSANARHPFGCLALANNYNSDT